MDLFAHWKYQYRPGRKVKPVVFALNSLLCAFHSSLLWQWSCCLVLLLGTYLVRIHLSSLAYHVDFFLIDVDNFGKRFLVGLGNSAHRKFQLTSEACVWAFSLAQPFTLSSVQRSAISSLCGLSGWRLYHWRLFSSSFWFGTSILQIHMQARVCCDYEDMTTDFFSACSGCRYLSCIPTSSNNHCQGTGAYFLL